jgi:hypothetical protein
MRFGRSATVTLAAVAVTSGWMVSPPVGWASGCVSTAAGMTAAVDVEGAPATLTGTVVNATGCDIGIYVGPGADGTVIDGATVSGANDHGVLVQDVADVVVRNSTITGNGLDIATLPDGVPRSEVSGCTDADPNTPCPTLSEDKALTLLGTTNALVENNNIVGNVGDGGISINDDGNWPSMSVLTRGQSRPAVGNVLHRNTVSGNLNGCAIVLSAWNPGQGVNHNVVNDNTVTGQKFSGVTGSIVVAADPPGTSAIGNVVLHNTVTFSLIPGIIVHSNAPGDLVAGTKIIHNTLVSDNWVPGADSAPGKRVGIAIASEAAGAPSPSVITNTLLVHNSITDEDYGIWIDHANGTRFVHNSFTNVGTNVFVE